MFRLADQEAPSIVFIDEIDAVTSLFSTFFFEDANGMCFLVLGGNKAI